MQKRRVSNVLRGDFFKESVAFESVFPVNPAFIQSKQNITDGNVWDTHYIFLHVFTCLILVNPYR